MRQLTTTLRATDSYLPSRVLVRLAPMPIAINARPIKLLGPKHLLIG